MVFIKLQKNAILTHKAEGLCKPAIGILFPPAIFIMLSLIPVSVMGNNNKLQARTVTAKNSTVPKWNPYPNGMNPKKLLFCSCTGFWSF